MRIHFGWWYSPFPIKYVERQGRKDLTAIKNWSKGRQIEQKTRIYSKEIN